MQKAHLFRGNLTAKITNQRGFCLCFPTLVFAHTKIRGGGLQVRFIKKVHQNALSCCGVRRQHWCTWAQAGISSLAKPQTCECHSRVSALSAVIFQPAFYLLGGRARACVQMRSELFFSTDAHSDSKNCALSENANETFAVRCNGAYFGRVNHFYGSKAIISPKGNVQSSEQYLAPSDVLMFSIFCPEG